MKRISLALFAFVALAIPFAERDEVTAQQPANIKTIAATGLGQAPDAKKVEHARGRKVIDPAKLARMKAASHERHHLRLKALPKATAAVYDCRALGFVPPIRDQSQCGSCWDFSGSGMVTCALIKAGQIPNSKNGCSEQYTLDCGRNGGCNGDDNTTVLDWAKKTGLPLDGDYGPYQASEGRCKQVTKLYQIVDWGFCDGQGDGVTDTQKIKDTMVAYGPIGVAVAAGGGWWNSGQGTDTGRSTGIDHDVILVGWDDGHDNGDGSKGAWIMRNSWGTGWGAPCGNAAYPNPTEGGYGWMKYGADSIGTEAVWCTARALPPPPCPTGQHWDATQNACVPDAPVPPGPTPPTPPVPGSVSIVLTTEQVNSVVAQSGQGVTKDMTLGQLAAILQQQSGNVTLTPDDQKKVSDVLKLLTGGKGGDGASLIPKRMPVDCGCGGDGSKCTCNAGTCPCPNCTKHNPPAPAPAPDAALTDRIAALEQRLALQDQRLERILGILEKK
jgi:cathepsin L